MTRFSNSRRRLVNQLNVNVAIPYLMSYGIIILLYYCRDDDWSSRDREKSRRNRSRSRSNDRSSRGFRDSNGRNGSLKVPKWDVSKLSPFNKDFYVPQQIVVDRYLSLVVFRNGISLSMFD